MNKANECTCPSGDGSLVHPCPAHPAVEQAGGDRWDALQSIMEWTAAKNIPDDRKLCLIRNAARAALAQPSPVRSSLLINGYQLRAALDFIAPDGTAEQLKSEACIEWRQQDADFLEAGLYAFCAEYPEEGGVLLDEEPTNSQPSPAQAEQAEGAHVPDEVFAGVFAEWWEEEGQYCRAGGGDYERTFAFQAWRHLYPLLLQDRAALAQPSPAQAEAERPEVAEVAFVLRNIGAMDAEDIDGDNVDLRFEDAEGRDTGCDVSIVEYAEKAADLFEQHDRIVGELQAENAKLSESLDECDGDRWKLRSERDAANARLHEVATACATAEQERDAALARVAELETALEPFAAVADAYDDSEDDDHEPYTDMGCDDRLRLTLGQHRAGRIALEGRTPQAQAQHSGPEEFSFEYRHPNGESHTVTVSRDQVINEMPDFLFEALCSKFCNCEPAGETNVVECCCDEYAEEFKLLAAAPAQAQHSVPDGAADLCRFLAKLYCELDGLRYSTAKLPAEQIADALIFKWPVLQGARNQLNIKRISEQPYDESKLHSAIAAMLAAAPGKEVGHE
ncbi:hypothetical protein [Pseudomonas aeruginosa]|uniref:hypothetical protein n=1 Tax=Pseudomonas aeruginosa TaxID=287 RepID=UPI001CD70B89|nr:hypothetical protein [Pseudomonas aeruginosa]